MFHANEKHITFSLQAAFYSKKMFFQDSIRGDCQNIVNRKTVIFNFFVSLFSY